MLICKYLTYRYPDLYRLHDFMALNSIIAIPLPTSIFILYNCTTYYTILLSIKDGGNVQLFCGGKLMHNEQRNFFSNYQHVARKKLVQSPWNV